MTSFKALMQREWLQHRTGWKLLALLPLGIALLLLSVGDIQLGDDTSAHHLGSMPLPLAVMSMVATLVVVLGILWLASLFQVSGLARRDHQDRSIEFWLSLPTGHAQSLAAPLVVHLLLVPLAALGVGLVGGVLVSLVLVARTSGVMDWIALPWAPVLASIVALAARLAVGIPLATLWLLPLILLAVLANAGFKRWGLPVLGVAFGLVNLVLVQAFGQPLLYQWVARMFGQARRALWAAEGGVSIETPADMLSALHSIPGWLLTDAGEALADLASPAFLLGLAVSAACFLALVAWRRRG